MQIEWIAEQQHHYPKRQTVENLWGADIGLYMQYASLYDLWRRSLCAQWMPGCKGWQKRILQLDISTSGSGWGNIDVFQLRWCYEGGDASKSKI